MTDTDLSTWLPIADAAARLGVSTRTVERLAAAHRLEQRTRPQAGTPGVAVYSPESVAEEAAKRQQAPPPFVVGGNGNGAKDLTYPNRAAGRDLHKFTSAPDDPIRQLFAAALRAVLSSPSPPVAGTVAETPWVDVPAAAAILGRSQAYVRRQIKGGRLKAERDRRLVVRRKDLEAL